MVLFNAIDPPLLDQQGAGLADEDSGRVRICLCSVAAVRKKFLSAVPSMSDLERAALTC